MKIGNFVLGPVGTNCYIAGNEKTKECFIVDPAACPPEFISYIKSSGFAVKAVLGLRAREASSMGRNAVECTGTPACERS